jgi:hypothetical protein
MSTHYTTTLLGYFVTSAGCRQAIRCPETRHPTQKALKKETIYPLDGVPGSSTSCRWLLSQFTPRRQEQRREQVQRGTQHTALKTPHTPLKHFVQSFQVYAMRFTVAEDCMMTARFRSHDCTKYLGDQRVAEAW